MFIQDYIHSCFFVLQSSQQDYREHFESSVIAGLCKWRDATLWFSEVSIKLLLLIQQPLKMLAVCCHLHTQKSRIEQAVPLKTHKKTSFIADKVLH